MSTEQFYFSNNFLELSKNMFIPLSPCYSGLQEAGNVEYDKELSPNIDKDTKAPFVQ